MEFPKIFTMEVSPVFRTPSNPEPIINTLATSKVKTFLPGDRVGGNPIPISLRDGWKIQQGPIGFFWKYIETCTSSRFMIVPWCLFPSHVSWNRSARREPWKKETHDVYTLHTTGEKIEHRKRCIDPILESSSKLRCVFLSSFPAKASTQKRRWNGDMDGISREGTLPKTNKGQI